MSRKKINKAIQHLGLTVEGQAADGCYYFLDKEGHQVGDSVYVGALSHLNLAQWRDEAEFARKHEHE